MYEREISYYGTGKVLNDLIEVYPEILQQIETVFDGDLHKVGTLFHGMEIKDRKEIESLEDGTVILVSSIKFFDEITKDINELNDNVICKTLFEILDSIEPSIGKCNICHKNVPFWLKTGENVTTKYEIYGNGERMSTCPYCISNDRRRWLSFVLKNFTEIHDKELKVLHFAPEFKLSEDLRKMKNLIYVTGDIQPGRADYVVDITDICFESSSFDMIIAIHVLEHIQDEQKAISELKRCLKPDGMLLLSFPYTTEVKTIEGSSDMSIEDMIFNFGQNDHVRLYGNDFAEQLEKYGINVEVIRPIDVLSSKQIDIWNLIPQDIILKLTIEE